MPSFGTTTNLVLGKKFREQNLEAYFLPFKVEIIIMMYMQNKLLLGKAVNKCLLLNLNNTF